MIIRRFSNECSWNQLALLVLCLGVEVPAGGAKVSDDKFVVTPMAAVETEAIPSKGDAADDRAIWVHPDEPGRSLVLGTDKKGGLNVFDLAGRRIQIVSNGSQPNNVDVLYGFPLARCAVDLAVAGIRSKTRPGVSFGGSIRPLAVSPSWVRYRLLRFSMGESRTAHAFTEAHETTRFMFLSPTRTAQSNSIGSTPTAIHRSRQHLFAHSMSARPPRDALPISISVGFTSPKKRLESGSTGAEPHSGSARTLVARVGDHGIAADLEGLTLYYGSGSKGYLIASSQGSNTFKVFEREASECLRADHRSVRRRDCRRR